MMQDNPTMTDEHFQMQLEKDLAHRALESEMALPTEAAALLTTHANEDALAKDDRSSSSGNGKRAKLQT